MQATAGDGIFAPFIGMCVLTFAVWTYMYVRRIHFMHVNRIGAERLRTPERATEIFSEDVACAANNLRNLFELPVIFYALCLYLFVTNGVDPLHVISAWAFLGFRVLHSLVHCTINVVMLRFVFYVLGAAALWFMLARVLIAAVG
ncbi:MAG: MAPEG family protein [Woeseiaceae bacterium]|nr:MAPEG family protein [Woeseiaceae bacterium]